MTPNEDIRFWEETPDRFAQLQLESRIVVLHPFLRAAIAESGARRLLDYGCGDGALIAKPIAGVESIALFDTSQKMREIARCSFQERADVTVYDDPAQLPHAAFDAVVLSLVLMTLRTRDEQLQVLSQLVQAKSPGSLVLIAVTHPCFRQHPFSTFAAEFAEGTPFPYLADGTPFQVTLDDGTAGPAVRFTDYHWTLATTFNLLTESGLSVTNLTELEDCSSDPRRANPLFPPYLVLQCR